MQCRTWAALVLLIAMTAPSAAARQEPDTLSNREARQRLGWAIARERSAVEEHEAALRHLLLLYAAFDARVRADSLAALVPDSSCAYSHDPCGCVAIDQVECHETPPPPTGGQALFRDGFESGSLSHDENGASWGGSKNVSVTDRIAHSGSHALQFFYQGTNLDRDGHAEQRFYLGRQVRELWVEYWIYYPDGSEGLGARYVHRDPGDVNTNNKFFVVWGGDYNQAQIDGAWMGFSTRRYSGGDSYFETQATERAPHVINHLLRPVTRQLTDAHRGRWARFRAHFRLGVAGVAEGWLDGELIGRYAGPVGAADPAIDYLDNGYLLGWANSGYSEDTYIFIDDVSFYTSNPGW